MRLIILSVTTLLGGSLFVVYGTLLAWRPDVFLKFHDTFVDRGRIRNAAWRRDLGSLGAKMAAASFVMFGVFIIYVTLAKMTSSQN
jgi:hypothetical protein